MKNAKPREPWVNAQRRMTSLRLRPVWMLILLVFVSVGCSALGGRGAGGSTGETPAAASNAANEEMVGPPAPPRVAQSEVEGPPEMVGPPAPHAASRAESRESHGAGAAAPVREARVNDADARLLAALERGGFDVHPSARGPVVVFSDTIFEFGTSTLQRDARKKIHEVGRIVSERAVGAHVSVEGHTDSIGAELYNRGLSERRAAAVAAELAGAGIAEKLLTAKGFGSQFPIAPNDRSDGSDDPQGRARNRRVEIIVETAGAPPA